VKDGNDEYGFENSMIIFGHSAVLPGRIKALRGDGKKALVIERNERYHVFVSPP
jgi:hypothetical protein